MKVKETLLGKRKESKIDLHIITITLKYVWYVHTIDIILFVSLQMESSMKWQRWLTLNTITTLPGLAQTNGSILLNSTILEASKQHLETC